MVTPWVVLGLGISQLVCWGVTTYLIGVFGPYIEADLGWSRTAVYGGFSAALVVMGLVSPLAGHLIDRFGGRLVMAAGSCLSALACAGIAGVTGLVGYYLAWCLLGVAMRLVLYDAAFAALARIDGAQARQAMSQITLLGGLASTVFWPIGHVLAEHLGWRLAVLAYGGFGLACLPLFLWIPVTRFESRAGETFGITAPPAAAPVTSARQAALLYVLLVTVVQFLINGVGAHLILLLTGIGMSATAAVSVSALLGIGQVGARVCTVLVGARMSSATLAVVAAAGLPVAFGVGLLAGRSTLAAGTFAFLYGACNGALTIARGTLPLVLFDPTTYGATVGRLLLPGFLASAVAPMLYAVVTSRGGATAALLMSLSAAVVALAVAIALKRITLERRTS